jgi:hypothetical protein
MKRLSIVILIALHFSACYFNPIVNQIVDPAKEKSNANLGLLALGGGGTTREATVQVVGQVKDLSSANVPNPKLMVSSVATTSQRATVSISVTGNGSGKFILQLAQGTSYTITVFTSSGTNLGSFLITVSSDNKVTQTAVSGASFSITNVVTYSATETVTLTEDTPAPTITSFTPPSGCITSVTITGTNFSTTPSENILTTPGCSFGAVTASTTTSLTTSVSGVTSSCYITVTVAGQSGTSSTQFGNGC